jgi:hypothetical protein
MRIIPDQPLGDTAWLAGGRTLDVDEEGSVHKLRRLLCREQSNASANGRARVNRGRKTNFVHAVVDAHRHSRADLDCLPEPVTQQRKREKTMSDGAAEERFTLGTFRVQVNPLAVLGGVGKFLDTILGDDEPVCRGEFASFELLQRIQILNLKGWHRSFA